MTVMRKALILLCGIMLVFSLAACHKEGPMEKAGKKIDKAAKKVGDDLEKAAEDLKDSDDK